MVAPTDIKYDFEPANPDPGDDYDKFRERALNAMSTSDDRGWSLSDAPGGSDSDMYRKQRNKVTQTDKELRFESVLLQRKN